MTLKGLKRALKAKGKKATGRKSTLMKRLKMRGGLRTTQDIQREIDSERVLLFTKPLDNPEDRKKKLIALRAELAEADDAEFEARHPEFKKQ